MQEPRFEIYSDVEKEWRWRLVGKNGEIVATGEGYTRKEDAARGARTTRRLVKDAEIVFVEPQ